MNAILSPSEHVMEGRGRAFTPKKKPAVELTDAQKELLAIFHAREFFPSVPWSVRAVMEVLIERYGNDFDYHDPCAGQGHLGYVLRKLGLSTHMSDLYDYGMGIEIADAFDFAGRSSIDRNVMITNPPFSGEDYNTSKPTAAERIVQQALKSCRHVVILARLGFLVSGRRHRLIYDNPLGNLRTFIPHFERVPLFLGRYAPKGRSATSYAWFHFEHGYRGRFETVDLPPGTRAKHERPYDRFLAVQDILDLPDVASFMAA